MFTSGCQAGTCEVDPGPPVSCEPSCGEGYYPTQWGEGCVTVQCSCANPSSLRCCPEPTTPPPEDTGTPHPTNTPSPSPAPTLTPIPTSTPVPSPTPIQPTVIITIPFPSPQAFSKKAATEVQKWVCLKVAPCSVSTSNCSVPIELGGHRVRITTKADAKLIANKKTYIFECLKKGTGYRCTTGNGPLDKKLTDSNYLSALSHDYGYLFVSLTDTHNHPIVQSYDNQVIITDSKGDLGPLEWESSTTVQVGRMMMAMQQVTESKNTSGEAKSQQLGTFFFDKNYNTTWIRFSPKIRDDLLSIIQ